MKKNSIQDKITRLKKKKNALILAHNYQRPEIQDAADYVGDSLGLSRTAAGTSAETIVFCGVRFMAETAKLLSPGKRVIMPDADAGCPMADMITRQGLAELKKAHPGAVVIGYVNTTAEVKTEIDICCTSGNALEVAGSIDKDREIIFVPDKYLADYVSKKTNRKLIAWNGYCPTHANIMASDVIKLKKKHPDAVVIAHPECRGEVIGLADETLSTEAMATFAKKTSAAKIIVATETGMIYRLKKGNTGKKFIPASENALCPNMKKTTLEKLLWSLEDMQTEITLPGSVIKKARKCVDRMIQLG